MRRNGLSLSRQINLFYFDLVKYWLVLLFDCDIERL